MTGVQRQISQEAEQALAESAAICAEIERERVERDARLDVLRRDRRQTWLRAVSYPESAVTRQRIADACDCSIQLVDADLKLAREEASAAAVG